MIYLVGFLGVAVGMTIMAFWELHRAYETILELTIKYNNLSRKLDEMIDELGRARKDLKLCAICESRLAIPHSDLCFPCAEEEPLLPRAS